MNAKRVIGQLCVTFHHEVHEQLQARKILGVSTYRWTPQGQKLGCPDTADTNGLTPIYDLGKTKPTKYYIFIQGSIITSSQ